MFSRAANDFILFYVPENNILAQNRIEEFEKLSIFSIFSKNRCSKIIDAPGVSGFYFCEIKQKHSNSWAKNIENSLSFQMTPYFNDWDLGSKS